MSNLDIEHYKDQRSEGNIFLHFTLSRHLTYQGDYGYRFISTEAIMALNQ